MRRGDSVAVLATVALVAWLGCGEAPPSVEPEAEVTSEEQARREMEARRNEEAAVLAQRGTELEQGIAELRAATESSGPPLPESVAEAVGGLDEELGKLEGLRRTLEEAGAESWEEARDRLQVGLDEARAAYDAAAARLEEWRGKEQETLAKRRPLRLPIDEETGLIAGLDGGEYPHYHVFRIERVQRRLRELGLYAGPADGYLDEVTMASVARFQEQNELHVSGVPSPMTRAVLFPDPG